MISIAIEYGDDSIYTHIVTLQPIFFLISNQYHALTHRLTWPIGTLYFININYPAYCPNVIYNGPLFQQKAKCQHRTFDQLSPPLPSAWYYTAPMHLDEMWLSCHSIEIDTIINYWPQIDNNNTHLYGHYHNCDLSNNDWYYGIINAK